MAFHIQRGESLHHAIKRMAQGELDQARVALETAGRDSNRGHRNRIGVPGESVHDLRIALKRTRALARLAAPAVGRAAHRADRALRALARKLGPVRDSQVLLLTFNRLQIRLRARSPGVPDSRKLTEAHRALAALRREGAAALSIGAGRVLAAKLGRARREVARWAPEEDRWRALAPGLTKAYRRCHRRMRVAYAQETPAAFHAWRRAIKYHRYQVQALAPLWPEELEARQGDLAKLSDLLGEQHDLALLADTLREQRVCTGDDPSPSPSPSPSCRQLLAALETWQRELRALARPLGQRLFAETPEIWARGVRAHFHAFRREPPSIAAEVKATATRSRPPSRARASAPA